jgi:hypothetical protein
MRNPRRLRLRRRDCTISGRSHRHLEAFHAEIGRRSTPALSLVLRGATRCFSCRLAKLLSRNIDYSEPPTLLRERLKICLDEYLDGFLARVNFDANRRIAKIDLVSATVFSSNDGVCHKCGERDLWRLANGAIGELRRERRAS